MLCEPALIHFLGSGIFDPHPYRASIDLYGSKAPRVSSMPHLFQAIQDDSKHEESLGQLPFDQPQTHETNL